MVISYIALVVKKDIGMSNNCGVGVQRSRVTPVDSNPALNASMRRGAPLHAAELGEHEGVVALEPVAEASADELAGRRPRGSEHDVMEAVEEVR